MNIRRVRTFDDFGEKKILFIKGSFLYFYLEFFILWVSNFIIYTFKLYDLVVLMKRTVPSIKKGFGFILFGGFYSIELFK